LLGNRVDLDLTVIRALIIYPHQYPGLSILAEYNFSIGVINLCPNLTLKLLSAFSGLISLIFKPPLIDAT